MFWILVYLLVGILVSQGIYRTCGPVTKAETTILWHIVWWALWPCILLLLGIFLVIETVGGDRS